MCNFNVKYVDALIEKYLPIDGVDGEFINAVEYSLNSGGKRVRPITMLKLAYAMNCLVENIERLAVALELIHCYSLVHDDLPCMDDDDYRRGKLSVHKKFGEAVAVLVGDFLLNSSAEVASFCSIESKTAVNYLHKCGRQMIHGQVLDINGTLKTLEDYYQVAINKTGALMRCAVVVPCLYSGIGDSNELEKIANKISIIYQIADDLQDETVEPSSILSIMSRVDSQLLLNDFICGTNCLINDFSTKNKVDLQHLIDLTNKNISYKA